MTTEEQVVEEEEVQPTEKKLKFKPSAIHPAQRITLFDEDEYFIDFFNSTRGNFIWGPAEVLVYWHYDGIEVVVREKGEGKNE